PGFVAMRDELLFRGLVLRVLPDTTPGPIALFCCGLSSAAAAFGAGAKTAPEILTAGLGGIAFGALWRRDRGAWLAWGAHTSWLVTTDLFFRGGLYEAHVAASSWGGADAGPLGGAAAVVALLPFSAAAIVWAARR